MGGLSMKIENWKGYEIRFVHVDGEWWAVAKDIAEALGYSDTSQMTRTLSAKELRKYNWKKQAAEYTDFFLDYKYKAEVPIITETGIKSILARMRKPEAIKFADVLGLDVIPLVKEQEYSRIIKAAFKHLEVYEQYPVGNYRVDLYIPSLNLVVECDEYGHEHYDLNTPSTYANAKRWGILG